MPSAFKPLFYPLQGAVKKYAGVSFKTFVQNAFAYYRQQWSSEADDSISYITPLKKCAVVNEQYPYLSKQGNIVSLYNDSRHIDYFKVDNRKVAVRDIAYDNYYSYNNNKLVYATYKPDVRWANREYSEIRLLDINNGKRKKVTSKTRYFSPDISHDGKTIAAVETNATMHSALVIMDVNGNIISKYDADNGSVFSYPKFSLDDKHVFIIERNSTGNMRLLQQTITDTGTSVVLPYAKRIIGFPVVQNDTLLFTCSNNGKDELWAYLINTNTTYKLADVATGLYQGIIKNSRLISTSFTANGYRLAVLQPAWQRVNISSDTLTNLYVTNIAK